MGDIVNLRRARKAQNRQRDEDKAAQNRVAFGLSKAEKKLASARRDQAEKQLDGHLLSRDDQTPPHPEPLKPKNS